MDIALLTARLLLATVFLVAGIAKLVDRAGSGQALISFGIPAGFASLVALFLPLSEIAVAIALVPALCAQWGALGALVLLLVFTAGISVNLARGHKPECQCFGQLHSAPIGWQTLARNGALAAMAAFVLWQGWNHPGFSALGWIAHLTAAQAVGLLRDLVLLAGLVVEGWLLLHLLRQHGRLLVRMDALEAQMKMAGMPSMPAMANTKGAGAPPMGLPVRASAPAFALPDLNGNTRTLEDLRASGKPVLLVFSDPNCGPCSALLPKISRWQQEDASLVNIALISRGTAEENRARTTQLGIRQVFLQNDSEVAQAYQAYGTPSAVLVLHDGTIGSPVVQGADAIQALISRVVGLPSAVPVRDPVPAVAVGNGSLGYGRGNGTVPAPLPSGLAIGELAPTLSLPDLTGKIVDLTEFRGSKTLLLFWNPGCGFCQQMESDLRAWEAHAPKNAPKLLMISTGTSEQHRSLGLRAPVLLDSSGFAMGRAFDARGTPSAVLVDAEGKIASEVAVGAAAVLALAGVGAVRPCPKGHQRRKGLTLGYPGAAG